MVLNGFDIEDTSVLSNSKVIAPVLHCYKDIGS